MQNYLVNGVPLFGTPALLAAPSSQRTTLAAMDSLRTIARWAERMFGVPLGAPMLDVLHAAAGHHDMIDPVHIAAAAAVPLADAEALLAALEQQGFVGRATPGGMWTATPRLQQALHELEAMLQRAFVSRAGLRDTLLALQLDDAARTALVERLFDRFFDLGWLYLHNWAGHCHLMALLVAQAMRLEGRLARTTWGAVQVRDGGQGFRLGTPGSARPGQIDGHAFCIVDETFVVDFGLGNLRKGYRREAPWAVAAEADLTGEALFVLDHPALGQATWRQADPPPDAVHHEAMAQALAGSLLEVYARSVHGPATAADAGGVEQRVV